MTIRSCEKSWRRNTKYCCNIIMLMRIWSQENQKQKLIRKSHERSGLLATASPCKHRLCEVVRGLSVWYSRRYRGARLPEALFSAPIGRRTATALASFVISLYADASFVPEGFSISAKWIRDTNEGVVGATGAREQRERNGPERTFRVKTGQSRSLWGGERKEKKTGIRRAS